MPFPMRDMLVVIPGILGSTVLDRDKNELWEVKRGTLLSSIRRLGRNFQQLRLAPGISDGRAPDGVQPGALIPIHLVVGRLLGTHGYGHLLTWLTNVFDLRRSKNNFPKNLIAFPSDWRLSNRVPVTKAVYCRT